MKQPDGWAKYPSVSKILAQMLPDEELLNWRVRRADAEIYTLKRAHIGRKVHYLCYATYPEFNSFKDSIFEPDIELATYEEEEVNAMISNFKKWKENHKFFVDKFEHKVVNREVGYKGIIDMICVADGLVALIDLKTARTTKGIDSWAMQLTAYKKAFGIEEVKPYVLMVRSNPCKYVEITEEKQDIAWEDFQTLVRYYYDKKAINDGRK